MKRIFALLLTFVALAAVTFVATPVFAADNASKKAACDAIGGIYDSGSGACSTGQANAEPEDLVARIIQIFSWVVGAISVIMLIFGGFKYVTSGGDAGKITSAKNTIIYALIGIVIVALSQVIVNFVLNRAVDASKKPTTLITKVVRYS